MKKVRKVAIGVPSNDMIHADFAMSLVNLTVQSFISGIMVSIINQKSSVVEIGRCEIVKQAKQLGAEKLLFLDSDMVFPADTLIKLLARNKDIVCLDAVRRRPPYTQVLKGLDGKPIDHVAANGNLVELKGASAACMLVDMKVFDNIEGPPFLVTYNEEKENFVGEDYYFTNKLREKGYKVYCDTELSKNFGHLGTYPFTIEGVTKSK